MRRRCGDRNFKSARLSTRCMWSLLSYISVWASQAGHARASWSISIPIVAVSSSLVPIVWVNIVSHLSYQIIALYASHHASSCLLMLQGNDNAIDNPTSFMHNPSSDVKYVHSSQAVFLVTILVKYRFVLLHKNRYFGQFLTTLIANILAR